MTPEPAPHNDLRGYLRILWRWKLLFLLFLVAAPVAIYAKEAGNPKHYRSSTLLQLQGVTLDPSLFGGQAPSSNDNLLAIARLVTTTPIATGAAGLLRPPPAQATSLIGQVQASADIDTGFLTITATDVDPRRAAEIANAFAASISDHQTRKALGQLDFAIAGVTSQLAKLAQNDTVGRSQLSDRLQQLRAVRASQGRNAVVIERAVPSFTPVGGSTRRAVELGLVIGLLLGFGAVVLAENSDRRVRTPEDLEALSGLPLLSAIPSSAFSARGGGDPRDDEAFKRLRGALTYFNVGRPLSTVVITSPGQQDGKTTVAVRLAVEIARAGKAVILVEADLRRPQVAQRLGLDLRTGGLASVLIGERSVSEALIDYHLADDTHVEATAGGSLRVLPGGPIPPNPSELLASQEMERMLDALEDQADLVLIDTPAALAVSDVLPLVPSVSGVVIVARMNRTTRAAVRRLQQIIATANGVALGIVATGTAAREGYEGYSYRYYETGGKSWRGRRRARREARNHAPTVPGDIPRGEDPIAARSPESRSA